MRLSKMIAQCFLRGHAWKKEWKSLNTREKDETAVTELWAVGSLICSIWELSRARSAGERHFQARPGEKLKAGGRECSPRGKTVSCTLPLQESLANASNAAAVVAAAAGLMEARTPSSSSPGDKTRLFGWISCWS